LRKFLAVIAGLVIFAAGIIVALPKMLSVLQKPMSQTYVKDNGYFYRFRAGFEVKATGERLDFDYVVACNIRLTRWRDGGLSNDTSHSPRAMYKATRDGQVVMLRTLEACHGLTSEYEDIPPDVLPLAIWFDDVADLSAGLGYVSEDAYDNPLGKMKFHGARVDRATRADWEAWRAKSAEEYVQRGVLPGPWGYDFPNPPDPAIGPHVVQCDGYKRLKLPENMRPELRALWPDNRPRFWTLPKTDERKLIGGVIDDPNQPLPPGVGRWSRRFGSIFESRSEGLPIRSGRIVANSLNADGSRRRHIAESWPAEIYPFVWQPLTSIMPVAKAATAPGSNFVLKLEYREGALNGFAACQNASKALEYNYKNQNGFPPPVHHVFEIDDLVVKPLVGKLPVLERPSYVAERDEAVFLYSSAAF
jgi:hypothetical protein